MERRRDAAASNTRWDEDKLLSPEEVSQQIRIPVATLYQWRHQGKGPRALKVGRHLRYPRRYLNAWLDQQSETSLGRWSG